MTTTKKSTKTKTPRAKKVKPHPLAGINPELDALAALTPWPLNEEDLSDAEVNLIAAAAAQVAAHLGGAKVDREQGGDGYGMLSGGAKILCALERYVDAQGIY